MQRPDPRKRREIMTAAARLFAAKPFHEVLLDDVAAAAHIGKGTLYVYFASKADLFLSLVREGFTQLVESIEADLLESPLSAWDQLGLIIDGFVGFATRFPHLFRLLRTGVLSPDDAILQRQRRRLSLLIERTIREGVRRGELVDTHPDLTAQYVLSFVRGALLFGPRVSRTTLRTHLLTILAGGLRAPHAAGMRAPVRKPRTARVGAKGR